MLLSAAENRAKSYFLQRLLALGASPYLSDYVWSKTGESAKISDSKVGVGVGCEADPDVVLRVVHGQHAADGGRSVDASQQVVVLPLRELFGPAEHPSEKRRVHQGRGGASNALQCVLQ